MSSSPIEHAESLRIGAVDFVSPDEIKASVDIEAPETVSLNAGGPRPFPRINSYVLMPVDDGFLVGQIEWLTVERSPFPKRRGMQDFGLIDLPFPLRKMSLNPLGTLHRKINGRDDYTFRRGAVAFPSIGTSVLLPTVQQLRSIVESGEKRRVKIGTSALAGNAEVFIDPDRLFGRHLAVLGNTGSGKSCSVAGIVRWSLESAKSAAAESVNSRFIILDPNGEYSKAFADLGVSAKIFKVSPDTSRGELPLRVPIWLWNSAEWCSFAQASHKTQKPTLIQALRFVRDGQTEAPHDKSHEIRRFLRTISAVIRVEINTGGPWGAFPKPKSFYEKLEKWKTSLEADLSELTEEESLRLRPVIDTMEALCAARRPRFANMDFIKQEVEALGQLVSEAHLKFGGTLQEIDVPDVDAPRPFSADSLVQSIEAASEMLNVSEHVETLLIRVKSLLSDKKLKEIVGSDDGENLGQWLTTYICSDDLPESRLTIIDLSLVPTEVIHILTAVIARMVFEALQRYRKMHSVALPTVLVMEEAHTFIKRYKDDTDNHDAASVCCQVFEKIAREGRKFGLGLVLSSQRPSELSPTVLSQCNTFLLHRISNDRDQELVHRLVPDNLKGLLRELPSLASQSAILLGWASELPVLVTMNDLPKAQQPQSEDPDFWGVWTGIDAKGNTVERNVNWQDIAKDWLAVNESVEQKSRE